MSIATQVMNQFSSAGGAIGGVVGKTAEKAADVAGAVAGNPISTFKLLENSPVPANNNDNSNPPSLSDGIQPKLDKPDEQTLPQWNPPALLAEAHRTQEMQAKMMTQMSVEQMMQKGWDNIDG